MVEVQVRVNDDVDVLGFQLQFLEFRGQNARVLNPINFGVFCVELVPDAGFHQNVVAAGSDQQASQAQRDAIALVGGDSFSPERLGNNREHLAAIKVESSVGKRVDVKCSKFHDSSTNSISTPEVLEG